MGNNNARQEENNDENDEEEEDDDDNALKIPNFSSAPQDNKDEVNPTLS